MVYWMVSRRSGRLVFEPMAARWALIGVFWLTIGVGAAVMRDASGVLLVPPPCRVMRVINRGMSEAMVPA